jgi:hypothetical protein
MVGLGMIQNIHGDPQTLADIVPVDFVAKQVLSSTAYVAL